jgi:hypothetical protein
MHQILTHLVAVIDISKEPHELVVKSGAVSRLSYAQERARDFRSQHTDINHLVVIAEIIQVQRRSEDIYTTDPRGLGIAKSDNALEKLNPGRRLDVEGQAPHTTRDDGWIEWNGGECPVGPDVMVEFVCRNGETDKCHAKNLRWSWVGTGGDIIKYRVVKP